MTDEEQISEWVDKLFEVVEAALSKHDNPATELERDALKVHRGLQANAVIRALQKEDLIGYRDKDGEL